MYKAILVALAIFITGYASAQVEVRKELPENQKIFDMTKLEHRYAISKIVMQAFNVDIRPLKNNEILHATKRCLNEGIMRGDVGINLPSGVAIDTDNIICSPSPEYLSENDNEAFKDICKLFDMEFVSKPTEASVLCEKTTEEERGLQKQFRSEGRSSLKRA